MESSKETDAIEECKRKCVGPCNNFTIKRNVWGKFRCQLFKNKINSRSCENSPDGSTSYFRGIDDACTLLQCC